MKTKVRRNVSTIGTLFSKQTQTFLDISLDVAVIRSLNFEVDAAEI